MWRSQFRPTGKPLALPAISLVIFLCIVSFWNVLGSMGASVQATATKMQTIKGLGQPSALAWSHDNKRIAVGNSDGTIRIVDVVTGRVSATHGRTSGGHPNGSRAIHSLAFSPDGNLLASAGEDKQISLWDLKRPKTARLLKGHKDPVYSLSFSPDGKTLASASGGGLDFTLRLWSPATGKNIHVTPVNSFGQDIAYSKAGDMVSVSVGSQVQVFRVEDAKVVGTFETGADDLPFSSVAFSPDGKMVLSSQGRLWSVDNLAVLGAFLQEEVVMDLKFPNGSTVVFAGQKTVSIWDFQKRRKIGQIGLGEVEATRVRLSPDGWLVAAFDPEGTLTVWNLAEPARRFESAAAKRPDSREIEPNPLQPMGQTLHSFHTATPLPSGKVIAAGGWSGVFAGRTGEPNNEVTVYDVGAHRWTVAAPMSIARSEHTATLLPAGNILVTGGVTVYYTDGFDITNNAEIYMPRENQWIAVNSMTVPRARHTATLLPDGTVLVVGMGGNPSGVEPKPLRSPPEIYSPVKGKWLKTHPLGTDRYAHTASVLENGKVIVVGGIDSKGRYLASCEIYDPRKRGWSKANPLQTPRSGHRSILLSDGKLLVVGGEGEDGKPSATTELYDPSRGTWTTITSLSSPRKEFAVVRLANGNILVSGGTGGSGSTLETVEVYDPAKRTWNPGKPMARSRANHSATLLPDGKVLIAGGTPDNPPGGFRDYPPSSSFEIYDPGVSGRVSPNLTPKYAITSNYYP